MRCPLCNQDRFTFKVLHEPSKAGGRTPTTSKKHKRALHCVCVECFSRYLEAKPGYLEACPVCGAHVNMNDGEMETILSDSWSQSSGGDVCVPSSPVSSHSKTGVQPTADDTVADDLILDLPARRPFDGYDDYKLIRGYFDETQRLNEEKIKLKADIKALVAEKGLTASRISELTEEVDALAAENKDLLAALENRNGEYDAIVKVMATVTAKFKRMADENARMGRRLQALETRLGGVLAKQRSAWESLLSN
jgi:uncharacterized protein (UPF0335 family)